ncbi:MAG: M20/M25/M40 family metallo-hydrolase [Leptolyngbya sp. PLA2]|nr:M20/M25/M40 family metallo-hydrolase [Leptolyngbya sp.]MCE7972502.1 M20/M25/M40 family metallo-hydrolase [Leptolyngbya sp. PL-A2]MCQ3941115.1 glutamate carboxypeptidase [cyanobacterium CYA1]MCZ7633181.1 M20/M25/M40 family metallo-hydrolase [Phycisphaerales bacterium]MDL1905398.1 M20/M25/M40 family metallo-hydrolase [Synechococcales cyanobacterium CNB]GIK18341.1 MAG: folate hydrolase [Planctomycetota bacterium]
MRVMSVIAAAALCGSLGGAAARQDRAAFAPVDELPWWPAAKRDGFAAYEARLNAIPDAERLWAWHDLLASRPHVAGMEGDRETIDTLAAAFADMGLEVEVHRFWAYLSRPIAAEVEVIGGGLLPLGETPLPEDPDTAADPVGFGWNAYSGSGEATGGVVYANYGRREDFERLAALGVDCAGKVVIARYGGNYRGFKAKFAEEAGAAALLIYSDPADDGYVKGLMYPEGGYLNDSCIQRGSIVTLASPGDPLTPGVEATRDAPRLDPDAVALPRIPVQPIGWGAAHTIMRRMRGDVVPQGWQGGLPLPYRVTGGDGLRVRVKVEQERRIVESANVLATLRGREEPERFVVIGCHHDAWGHGAADAMCGMISLMEAARAFSERAAAGERPRRSIVFAAWGAEEHGLIGSTEWVEGNRDRLEGVSGGGAVAYINLDMASMGPNFGAAATPSLRRVIASAAKAVPQARDPERSVFEAWGAGGEPGMGELGGGSDHLPFVAHAGVAGAGFSGGGSPGVNYHTAYDTLRWYRHVVGEDYEPALMIARMTVATTARLADAPLLPLDPAAGVSSLRRHLREITKRGVETGVFAGPAAESGRAEGGGAVAAELAALDAAAAECEGALVRALDAMEAAMAEGRLTGDDLARANAALFAAQRAWSDGAGLADRPWYKSLYIATDPDSGYGSWPLPGLRRAVEDGDAEAVRREVARLKAVVKMLRAVPASLHSGE